MKSVVSCLILEKIILAIIEGEYSYWYGPFLRFLLQVRLAL